MNLPPYDSFPFIAGDIISLRKIEEDDIKYLVEISFYDSVQASSIKEATKMQSKINNDYQEGTSIHWAIVNNKTKQIVGTCGYYRGFDKESGELGCVLLPQFHGQGFMTAALFLAMQFGLNQMKLNRIWATTGRQNHKSIQLLERLNFNKVEDLPNHEPIYEYMSVVISEISDSC